MKLGPCLENSFCFQIPPCLTCGNSCCFWLHVPSSIAKPIHNLSGYWPHQCSSFSSSSSAPSPLTFLNTHCQSLPSFSILTLGAFYSFLLDLPIRDKNCFNTSSELLASMSFYLALSFLILFSSLMRLCISKSNDILCLFSNTLIHLCLIFSVF